MSVRIKAARGFLLVSLLLTLPLLAVPALGTPYALPAPTPDGAFAGYKGVEIGATTASVRLKLGEPKDKSDTMDLYIFSDSESAQFYYSAARVVTAIMMTYTGDLKKAPAAKDIFGEDVPAKEDGSIFKMVRYPKAGYWVSYSRTAGNDATIVVAIQKI